MSYPITPRTPYPSPIHYTVKSALLLPSRIAKRCFDREVKGGEKGNGEINDLYRYVDGCVINRLINTLRKNLTTLFNEAKVSIDNRNIKFVYDLPDFRAWTIDQLWK